MIAGRSRLVAAAVLASVFLAGAVVGAATHRFLGSTEASASSVRTEEPERAGERPERPDSARERRERDGGPTSAMLEILRDDVGISEGQEERVRAVLERREERAHEVFEGVRERFHRWMDTTVARVKEELDEEQAADFERRLEELMEERRRDRRGRGGEAADSARDDPGSARGGDPGARSSRRG